MGKTGGCDFYNGIINQEYLPLQDLFFEYIWDH